MRLTNDVVHELVYDGRQNASGRWTTHVVWDDVEGFGVRLYPTGRKTWVLKYSNRYGKQRWHTIAPFPAMSATAARKEMLRLKQVIAEGGDPRAEREEERSGFDVGKLADEYIEKYAKQRKKSWAADEDRLKRHIRPAWGKRHPAEITRAHVGELHRSIASSSGKVEANRTLALVSKLWAWALKHGFATGDNPATRVEKYREEPKDRWVQHDEMRWVLNAIDAERTEHAYSGTKKHSKKEMLPEGLFIQTYFRLMLYTGARKSELLELEWRDVHLGRKELTFRDTKNGKDHTLPLSSPAAELLRTLPQVDGNPYVFVGRVEGRHLTSVQKAWERIRTRANKLALEGKEPLDVSDVTIHDLRRTVGAWLATAGYSELLIGRVLNHSVKSVTGIYARIADDAVAEALESLARQLANVQEAKAAREKIIELRR